MALTNHFSHQSKTVTSDSTFIDVVQGHLGGRAVVDSPVAELTTYKVGGRAAFYFIAESLIDLEAVAELQRRTGIAVVVLGRGSNVLFADSGFAGLVLQLGNFASTLEIPAQNSMTVGEPVKVFAGSGVPLPVVARQTAAAGLRGFEWAVGVPGTIGGGIRMNAGGHGSEMSESLRSIEVFHLPSGTNQSLDVRQINLRFRGSSLTDSDIVLRTTLELNPGSSIEAMAEIDEIVKWRRVHQPGGQNAGSVFVNPVPHQVSAGELIDRCGLRGFRIGSAEVSLKHANFIQADSQGRADDVVAVMQQIRADVARQTGYQMRSEVRLLGFPDDVVAELTGDVDTSSKNEPSHD
jgi:UDP-N-acetylmuramate dehydrogenase